VNINLGTLKSEIQHYLERSEFAVFHSHVGGLEAFSTISWDTDAWPDYRTFLETARKSGATLILFASREFEEDEILEATDEMDSMQFSRDDRREMEGRLKAAKRHIGETCSLELAFGQGPQMYVYELRPDWYDEFLDAVEEIDTLFTGGEDGEDAGDGLGGFYSNN
jgi:hypothetical protein